MKNLIRRLAGFCIFALLLGLVSRHVFNVLRWKSSSGIVQAYQYEDHLFDVAFFGTSHVYCGVNPALIWEDYGIASANAAESGQNIGSTYYYMKEFFKTQSPKVAFIDVLRVSRPSPDLGNGNIYRNTLGMKSGQNATDNIDYALSLSEDLQQDPVRLKALRDSLLYKFMFVHNRYTDLGEEDFTLIKEDIHRGRFRGSEKTSEGHTIPAAIGITEEAERVIGMPWLEKIIQLCREHDCEPIFFTTPYMLDEEAQKAYNTIESFCREQDVTFINFNKQYEDLDFDVNLDMQDKSHLNSAGAEKLSRYLGKYIDDRFDLPDHRGDARYSVLDDQLNYYRSTGCLYSEE